ncbi:SDR family NAD(P)-dependent oxidoreductase [Ruegeria lacuscaerulensis]|uniref:SDR family NAD(P)-dependent oxidoreductase n=1 Tax=Ruegeria lacuscaerulensis TaxID=55218 RepID=UPI00147AEDAA|nr:SDR family NAD(P)-dependent oxidoreductase [Ruegeria lacuscaerulensis]
MPSAENQKPVALAIGAGDGIGAAFARRFARAGYRVVIARRDAEKSAALVAELAAEGHELHAFSLDARDEDQVVGFFDKVEAEMGPIEVALYNAGSNSPFPFLETKSTMFRKIWELACFGGFLTMREAASRMVPRGKGTIRRHQDLHEIYGQAPVAVDVARAYFLRMAQKAARQVMTGAPYLLGETFTLADILLVTCLRFADRMGVERPAEFDDYFQRLTGRPAFQAAMKANHT